MRNYTIIKSIFILSETKMTEYDIVSNFERF